MDEPTATVDDILAPVKLSEAEESHLRDNIGALLAEIARLKQRNDELELELSAHETRANHATTGMLIARDERDELRTKLRAFLESLAVQHIDTAMQLPPDKLAAIGATIQLAARLGAHLMPPQMEDSKDETKGNG